MNSYCCLCPLKALAAGRRLVVLTIGREFTSRRARQGSNLWESLRVSLPGAPWLNLSVPRFVTTESGVVISEGIGDCRRAAAKGKGKNRPGDRTVISGFLWALVSCIIDLVEKRLILPLATVLSHGEGCCGQEVNPAETARHAFTCSTIMRHAVKTGYCQK